MKKSKVFIAIILSLLIIYPLINFAINSSYSDKKPNDSNYIPDKILSEISKNSNDVVVKIYKIPLLYWLINKEYNISQIVDLHKEEQYDAIYTRAREGDIYSLEYWRIDNDQNLTECRANERVFSVLHKYARHYNLLFASSFATVYKNIKVSEVYCFADDDECSIYFVTNKGDYIYYRPSIYYPEAYLMPVDKFVDKLDEVYFENIEKQTVWTGDVYRHLGLKPYVAFSALTTSLIVAIISIPFIIVWRKKQKRKKNA